MAEPRQRRLCRGQVVLLWSIVLPNGNLFGAKNFTTSLDDNQLRVQMLRGLHILIRNSTQLLTFPYKTVTTMPESCFVSSSEVKRFIIECMMKVGTVERHATSLANNLVSADHRGHYSHGLNRLEMYVNDVSDNTTSSADTDPKILNQTPGTAHIDGNNLLGPVVGEFCMKLAVEKAKNVGIALVSARHSNHFGICAYYSKIAIQAGLIGICFTNTSPIMIPTRSKVKTLGTNPLSLSAPGNHGDTFDLDMASTAVAFGKVEIAERREENIPTGWAVGADGQHTQDPSKVTAGGGLLPLGSLEETSSYKGYGLAMGVEVLTSVLSGAAVGPNVRNWLDAKGAKANLGQSFIAIDPSVFAGGFTDRMSGLMDHCRGLEPMGSEPVLVAGDPERNHMTLCDQSGGIPYHQNQITNANTLATKMGVQPLKVNNAV